jgi:tetratricopeptide (TPR) repeat protein
MNRQIPITHIPALVLGLICCWLAASCVQRPQTDPDPLTIQVAELKLNSGIAAYEQGNYYGAKIQFTDALTLYRSIDHLSGKAQAHLNLARICLAAGNYKKSGDHLARSRKLATQENITELAPHLDIMASSLAIKEKKWPAALRILEQHLPTTSEANHNSFALAALQNRILIAIQTEPSAVAHWVGMFNEILANNGKAPPAQVARLHRFQGVVAQLAGNLALRDKHFNSALSIYRQNAARPGIAATLFEWGSNAYASNQPDKGLDLLKRSLSVRISMQDYSGCIEVLEMLKANSSGNTEQFSHWLEVLRKKDKTQLPALLPERFSLREILDNL